jgi:hypothetical protein
MTERFLSEEDLDLKNLSQAELYAWWDEWLRLAQATNEFDDGLYSHGVFRTTPGWKARGEVHDPQVREAGDP